MFKATIWVHHHEEQFGLYDCSSQRSIEYWHWWSFERVEEVFILHLFFPSTGNKCNGIGSEELKTRSLCCVLSCSRRSILKMCWFSVCDCVCVMLRSPMFHIYIAFCWGILRLFFNCCCSFFFLSSLLFHVQCVVCMCCGVRECVCIYFPFSRSLTPSLFVVVDVVVVVSEFS